jgi:hypothetical protein
MKKIFNHQKSNSGGGAVHRPLSARLKEVSLALLSACCLLSTPFVSFGHGGGGSESLVDIHKTAKGWQAQTSENADLTDAAEAAGLHALNLDRIMKSATPAIASPYDVDVNGDGIKDIAIMPDNGRIIYPAIPANPIDIVPGTRLRWIPLVPASAGYRLERDIVPLSSINIDISNADTHMSDFCGPDQSCGDGYEGAGVDFPYNGQAPANIDILAWWSGGYITRGPDFDSAISFDFTGSAGRHVAGPQRLSPLFSEIAVDCGGDVASQYLGDRLVITWKDMPAGIAPANTPCSARGKNTFQAILYTNGVIEFLYHTINTAIVNPVIDPTRCDPATNVTAVVGLSAGGGSQPISTLDYSVLTTPDVQLGAVYEQFGDAVSKQIDTLELSKAFYQAHPDNYDYLVTMSNFPVEAGSSGLAYHAGIKNETVGIGRGLGDFSAVYGSAGELESFLWMNNINLWAGTKVDDFINPPLHKLAQEDYSTEYCRGANPVTPVSSFLEQYGFVDITGNGNSNGYTHLARVMLNANPSTRIPNSSLLRPGATRRLVQDRNSAMSIMFQEADHRWGAFTRIVHPVTGVSDVANTFDLLGRDDSHWSTFFNTRVPDAQFTAKDGIARHSGMEGNALIELGRNAAGKIIDKNSPSRALADPDGKLAAVLASCAAQGGRGGFLTEPSELTDGSTDLDQYLMGVRKAADVAPFWYVDNPTSAINASSLNDYPLDFLRGTAFHLDDAAFCGNRVNLTIDNIQNFPNNGKRNPVIGDENDIGPLINCGTPTVAPSGPCADVKTMAWILVVENPKVPAADITRFDNFRKAWQQYSNGPALGGRNADGEVRLPTDPNFIPKFDTSLEPVIH